MVKSTEKGNKVLDKDYDNLKMFISYYNQINIIRKINPKNILEIGVGNKTVSNYLKQRGYKVTTYDIDENLNPDIIGDVRNLPFKENEFDLVLCCEVLEHLPFEDSKKALNEIKRVTKNKVVISLPNRAADFSLIFKFPAIGKLLDKPFLEFLISFPIFLFFKKKLKNNHYWEIGYKGYSKRDIKKTLKKYFRISKEFKSPLNSYHHFFILNKKGNET